MPTTRLLADHVAAITEIRRGPSPLLWNTFPVGGDAQQRFRLFRDLSAQPSTRPDVGAYDIGSLNIVSFDAAHKARRLGYDLREHVRRHPLLPEWVSRTGSAAVPQHLRARLHSHRAGYASTSGLLDEPLLLKFYFSDEYGLPPRERSIEAYLDLLEGVRHEWFGCYIGGDALSVVPLFVSMGGHVRVGLEDFDYAGPEPLSNASIVGRAAEAIVASGHEVADGRRGPASAGARGVMSRSHDGYAARRIGVQSSKGGHHG